MPLGIGEEVAARFLHRLVQADRGHHVLQRAVLGCGIKRIVERNQRHLRVPRQLLRPGQQARIAAGAVHGGAEPDPAGGMEGQARSKSRVAPGMAISSKSSIMLDQSQRELASALLHRASPRLSSRVSRPQPWRVAG